MEVEESKKFKRAPLREKSRCQKIKKWLDPQNSNLEKGRPSLKSERGSDRKRSTEILIFENATGINKRFDAINKKHHHENEKFWAWS